MKTLKKTLAALAGAAIGCCFFVGCLSTKLSVTYMVDGETYRVQEYDVDARVSLPTPPTKEGYTFIGWYTDEALTNPYAEGTITAGMTLYAKFSVSTVYIVVNTAGGEKIEAIEVAPGADYTIPEAVKEGHTFLGYTYIDENGDEQDFPLSGKYPSSVGIKITAKYEVNKYTVTFVNNGSQEVAYGSVAIAPAAEKPGYTFDGWYTSETEQTDETKFDFTTAITGDITLYAKYTPKTFTITVNGAQQGYQNPTIIFGEKYSLVTPDRGANYEFVGFTMNGEEFPAEGVYNWTTDIAVDTVWDGIGKDIMFFDGATELSDLRIESEYGADMTAITLPAVPTKTGYTTDGKWYTDTACTQEFVAEGTISADVRLYAKYTANTYTITFKVWKETGVVDTPVTVTYGQTFTVPAHAERDAYNFLGYTYNGAAFDYTAAYTYTTDITVEEKWELREDASLFEYNKEGNYFKERENYDTAWTYVYVISNNPYTFADTVELSLVNPADAQYATVSGNSITAKAAGTFTVQVKNNGNIYNRTFKVVDYIQSMGIDGTTYDTAWGVKDGDYKRNSTGVWDATFTVGEEAMKVGKTNFIPELNYNGKVASFDGNFTATVKVDGAETTDYTVTNGAINFGDSLVGKRASVTIKPKYAVNANHQVTYDVEINNAMNVYDHADMKAAFADGSVHEVNVLRNIVAEIAPNEARTYVDEWGKTQMCPINYERLIDPATGDYYGTRFSTGVYVRRTGDMKINGNYFTVDGSKLPLVDARDGETDLHKPGSGYGLLDNRYSIFLFGRRHFGDMSKHQIDNLNIQGNGDMDAEASYKYDGVDVLKYSGSTINVHIAGGYLNMTNVTSRFGSFALYGYTHSNWDATCGVVINAKDCKLEKSWASNIYAQGFTDITLDSCFVGQANGASIHVDTTPSIYGSDAELNLLNDTDIQNWVTGQEAWFVGQNLTSAIPGVQVTIDNYIKTFSNNQKSILKDGKMNFAFMLRRKDAAADWIGGKDVVGSNWMAGADENYKAYLKNNYIGQGALNTNLKVLDLGYAGFMQAAGLYTADQINNYCYSSVMGNKYVLAPSTDFGYMEIFLEIVDKK